MSTKRQCCPKEPSRKIPRDIHEHARDVARSFAGTEGFEQSRRERTKIEIRFAHLKRIPRLGRLRLRGPRVPRMSLFFRYCSEPEAARNAGCKIAARPGSAHRVASELRNE